MKKYKLIKKLPFENSPEIGYVSIGKLGPLDHYWNGNWFNPEEYPEFWQEVVEKNYEILSLIHKEQHRILLAKDADIDLFLECKADYNYWKIHSVKRNDGEIFTVSETNNNQGKITSFEIYGNYLFVNIDSKYQYTLRSLKKIKQPLFTTEDGVDIFEGDTFCEVTKNFTLGTNIKTKIYKSSKTFSTKEKAEEYVILNKPVLSLNDIVNNILNIPSPRISKAAEKAITESLKQLVEQKLNNNESRKCKSIF